MRKGLKQSDIWIGVAGAIVLLSIFFAVLSNRSAAETLQVYDGSDEVTDTFITPEKEDIDIPTDIYVDNENHFSVEIPSGWTEVKQDGNPTFIHQPSGSSIQIQVKPYDPVLNNATVERYQGLVTENGYIFKNFIWTSNTSFELLYQDYKDSTYDYMEETYWDRDTSITLLCVFKDSYYQKVKPYYDKIVSTFAWEKQNPVPDGYVLYYDELNMYEIAVPDTWTSADAGGSLCVGDENTGAQMLVTVLDYDADLSGLTPSSMAELTASGRENYMLSSYDIQPSTAQAAATYTVGDVLYQSIDTLFCNGKHLIMITCTYETGMADPAIFDTCLSCFRMF